MTLISSHQPKRTLGPFVQWEQLNLICWGLLLVGFVLPFSIFVIASHRPPDGDFTGFYASRTNRPETHPLPATSMTMSCSRKSARRFIPGGLCMGPCPIPPQVGLSLCSLRFVALWRCLYSLAAHYPGALRSRAEAGDQSISATRSASPFAAFLFRLRLLPIPHRHSSQRSTHCNWCFRSIAGSIRAG